MKIDERHRWLRFPLLTILLILIGAGLFSKRGYRDFRAIVEKNGELRTRIQELENQKRDLERRNYLIQNSSEDQERVVRRVLGYVRPQELVVEFD